MSGRNIPKPSPRNTRKIKDKINTPKESQNLTIDFSKFHLNPICLKNEFNNYFKDENHFSNVATSFFSVILPKITSHTFKEICEGGVEGKELHFHAIDEKHMQLVEEVLKQYSFSSEQINQMFEGSEVFNFSATLGHTYPARAICHKVGDVLCLLFLDTNHHIYMNEKYVKNSLFYENCPTYLKNECSYMDYDCLAVSYLDEEKLSETYGYRFNPN